MTLYTTKEVAAILKVTLTTVYNLVKAGKLKTCRVGTNHRISEEQLKRFLQTGGD